MSRARLLPSLLALLAFGLGSDAFAHGSLGPAKETDLAAMSEAANLIVVAKIAGVQYVNVPIKGEQGTIPNGLVTIDILQTLRGKASGKTMTLRFLGGADGRGGIMGVNGVPMFEAGETNLLFIKANGDAVCPLVNCEWGRFRVLKDAMYNTHGSPVLSVTNAHVVARGLPPKELTKIRFPAPSFDIIMENPVIKASFSQMGMTYEEGKARYEREAPKFIEYGLNIPVELETGETIDDPVPAEIKDELKVPLNTDSIQAPLQGKNLTALPRPGALKSAAAKPAGPMSLKSFAAEVAKIAAGAQRPPVQVMSIDPSAEYILPAISPVAPADLPPDSVLPPDPKAEKEAADPFQGAAQQVPLNGPVVPKLPADGKTKPKN